MPNVGGVEYPYTPQGIAAAQQAYSGLVGGGVPQSGRGMLQNLFQQRQPTFQDVSHRPEQSTLNPDSQRPAGGNYLQDLLQFKALQEMMQSQAGIADQYQSTGIRPGTGIRQNWQTDASGNVMTNQFGAPTTYGGSPSSPNWGQSQNFGQLVGRAIGGLPGQSSGYNSGITQGQATQFGQSPWPPVQRPITQAPRGRTTNIGQTSSPRGQTIQTTNPGAGYGQSPSGPTAQMPRQPANYGQSPSNPNWKPPKP